MAVYASARQSILNSKSPSMGELLQAAERMTEDAEMQKYTVRLKQKLSSPLQSE